MTANWQRTAAIAVAALVLVVAAGVPLFAVVLQAIARPGGGGELLTARAFDLFAGSLLLAGLVTSFAVLLGVPLGVVLGLGRIPGRRVWLALHALPVFLPPLLLALGWFHLLGREGLLGNVETSEWLFARSGLVFVLGSTLTPLVTLCTFFGVRGVEPALVDAGRIVARPVTVVARIVVPLAWPAIAVGALLVFTLSFAEVAVPMFLRVQVYPATVFARLGGLVYAPGEAAVLALPVVLLALAIVAAERAALRRYADALSARGDRKEPLSFGAWAWLAWALVAAGVTLSSMPLVGLLARALRENGFSEAWARLGTTAENSLLVAGVASTAAVLLASVIGHGLARGSTLARWLDALALAAFLTPAAVTGVGAIVTWNRPATAWLYGTMTILALCLLGRYAVVAIRVFQAGVRQSPISHEEAATVGGAGYLHRLAGIVVPENWRSLIAAWLLCLVFCLRDVETAILLYPPGGETLPVRIFTLEANGPESTVAALALFHVALTLAALTPLAALARRRRIA